MLHITDHTLPPAGRAAVVSHGVNKGKGRAVKTSLGYAARHGFDALVLLDGMLKTCRKIWTGCYMLYRMKRIESRDERRA